MPERDPSATTQRSRDSQVLAPVSPVGLSHCVVGIGASAGGLAACRKFLAGLPSAPGMAFILVQHLDPTHQSLIAELLSDATTMPVIEATDGMKVEADHLYVIPPGLYISLHQGHLNLTTPLARHGARLPIDFLLHSLALAAGARAACVILSGGGADGSLGAQAIKAAGGLVIAQDPAEAGQASMPNSVIATGAVDLTLPAAAIAAALVNFASGNSDTALAGTAAIIALLKLLTPHDFTLYKTGTLDRRIARRMTMAGFSVSETDRYMERLRRDDEERGQLVNDLLINVTSFFRDAKIFDLLAETAIPELIATADGGVRLWVAGCSTGEETYSLAMLFLECMEAARAHIKLQIFATDLDAQAVTLAREGLYPSTIEKDVSPARLAQFFTREEHGYRVSPILRACVVFAVQDVLSDPPFSKLNMVSCRNLLIYLRPEAQAKIIAVFNFALRSRGFLLLGAAETVAGPDRGFEQVSKPARLYRKIAASGAGPISAGGASDFLRLLPPGASMKSRVPDLGEICRKLVLERYAPAALLINTNFEILYSSGATDEFLRTPAGPASHDLLAQLPPALRARVKDAVANGTLARIEGGRITRDRQTQIFSIEIQKVPADKDKFLVCFIKQTAPGPGAEPGAAGPAQSGGARISELESELANARTELAQAEQSLESAAEEHNAINEEALSVNEEFQSTNEELLTSKEELQSLNEELTALNSQLQESLERSRMTSSDLRNVLYSTDVPTLFLDEKLNIRFFTPSATLLFRIIPSDIGRKLADFSSAAADPGLLADAANVLASGTASEREIRSAASVCYLRRIQAYRTYDGVIAGVVITFNDITERNAASAAVEAARIEAEQATLSKSRFLAAASHDLRQPLQSMALISALLAKSVPDEASQKLVARLEHMMQSINTMLNAMLDINQIEAGVVKADIVTVNAGELLARLGDKFQDQAAAQNTRLTVMPCAVAIATDPALLEQILTNLLGNALKYAKAGRVLLGCRRQADSVRIEVWDNGIGIAADQLQTIFDEYHQINNPARERSRGFGLGLSIVQRLGRLLGHDITVRSTPGRGSVFSVDVPQAASPPLGVAPPQPALRIVAPAGTPILLIEDDPDIRELLANFLTEEGFEIIAARDAAQAKSLVQASALIPRLILADYNLPGGVTGLIAAQELRASLGAGVPVIIMTGDISTATVRLIAAQNCIQVNKPMKLAVLLDTIGSLIGISTGPGENVLASRLGDGIKPTMLIIDDDPDLRAGLRSLFEAAGKQVETFADAESFLAALPVPDDNCCLLVDASLPGMSGLELLQTLAANNVTVPAVMITGLGDIGMAVQAMKAGAMDFLEKPVDPGELLTCVRRVLDEHHEVEVRDARRRDVARLIAGLTARQREVMERVLTGQASKNIAADLGISQRTVENHRAAVMQKTGAKSIPALARLAMTAAAAKS